MHIEECLRVLAEKAAVVRYLAFAAALNPEIPDPAVLAGVGELCSEIETQVRALTRAMPLDVLQASIETGDLPPTAERKRVRQRVA